MIMSSTNMKRINFIFVLCLVVSSQGGHADSLKELSQLSLEQFSELDVVVTSVSRKPQKLLDTAAAVFVISNEDIKRSGVTSIPEALRMAPGIEVAQIDSQKWAISSRGFNGRFANKLLVLMDGRTVYTPLFSGVYWDTQDTVLEDIDRIEVIRGPATAIWGGNAMNGVINIITKKASETQGGLLTTGIGTELKALASGRYGGKLNDDMYYRLYAKHADRDQLLDLSGNGTFGGRDLSQAGFRLDWSNASRDNITLQGDIYTGSSNKEFSKLSLMAPFSVNTLASDELEGYNLLARWQHDFNSDNSLEIQAYYDHVIRKDGITIEFDNDIFDLDIKHQFNWNKQHSIIWGTGYRLNRDEIHADSFGLRISPRERTSPLYTAFFQDDIALFDGQLHLIMGSKFEHNDFTGFEYQPNARFRWTPIANHMFWGAVSRGLRITDRGTESVRVDTTVISGTPPRVVSVIGSKQRKPEEVIAYELGYRAKINNNYFFDLALFYNKYKDLTMFERGTAFLETTPAPAHLVIPLSIKREMDAESYGIELTNEWNIHPKLTLKGTYSYFDLHMHAAQGITSSSPEAQEGRSPHHQLSLRSLYSFSEDIQLDTWIRYVDELPDLNVNDYVSMNIQLSWTPINNLKLSVIGQNLIENSRQEFSGEILTIPNTQIQRGIFAKLQWQF